MKDINEIEEDVNDMIEEQDEPQETGKEGEDNPVKLIIVIGAIIIAFAVFFSAGYIYSKYYAGSTKEIETVEYHGFIFTYYEDLWHFQWQRDENLYNVHLRFNPYQVENVTVIEKEPFANFTDEFYYTFDPTSDISEYMVLATAEFGFSVKKVFNKTPTAACAIETDLCPGREVITCENTNKTVIFFKEEDETKVEIDGNCIIIQGKRVELLRALDRVLYEFYGIYEK